MKRRASTNFPFIQHIGKIRDGGNILAIFGLNKTATSTDFMISVELIAETDD